MIFRDLAEISQGSILHQVDPNIEIQTLVTDSRKPFLSKGALFFAIKGDRHDGHAYLDELLQKGVRNFVVTSEVKLEGANVLLVNNAVEALQKVGQQHRCQFNLPVIGITGSNGKTIVKEWLSSCLASRFKVVKTPHSFNSQIGVPLSVWNISAEHTLGIFEAGISTNEEMDVLADIIQPTVGIFTNLGSAHDEGFTSREQKFEEKRKLFKTADIVIHNGDNPLIDFGKRSFSWGRNSTNRVQIINSTEENEMVRLEIAFNNQNFSLLLPFVDSASIENAMHCVTFMLYMQLPVDYIQQAILSVQKLRMRLSLKEAINNSYLIDDTYNNDLVGLQEALSFLSLQKQKTRKIVILSDLPQTGLKRYQLYSQVADLIESASVDYLIGVGAEISAHSKIFQTNSQFFKSTEELIDNLETLDLSNSLILIKGARVFSFEKVVHLLEQKIHGTVLEINLDALTNNLNFYRSRLKDGAKLMVMVKAFAYGSGSFEVANLLQFHRVDYLGVAYADEGVELRKNGIYLPIMVMNANEASFEAISKHDLEPVIYDLILLKKYIQFLNGGPAKIHIELDTGMKRLGFSANELGELVRLLRANRNIDIQSIFSHMAAADEQQHQQFSENQAYSFQQLSSQIKEELEIEPLLHLVNSPGILRYPEFHFDMVRLGIGLYGLEANYEQQEGLKSISKLKTVISQIREVSKSESIGYGRCGKAEADLIIATIAIGYADGFTRSFSNGVGEVWVNGKRAPVIGNVCMDMTMIDITDCDAKVGDEVEIFGRNISIMELASKSNTIAYEILTNVSDRVKRVYYAS